ncbi:MAG: hypothetical protein R3Y26_09630 [Rikenellaceae bacterium]
MEEFKIGIVAEGISDYWVLKHIVERVLRNKDPFVIPLQPKVQANGKQGGYGGWKEVFNYIQAKDYIVELAQKEGCQYVIVQLDTDVSVEYGVDKVDEKEVLYNNVVNVVNSTVHEEFDKSRLIYAICIDSLECWLIPFVTTNTNDCNKISNCVNVVNKYIKASLGTIDKDQKGK